MEEWCTEEPRRVQTMNYVKINTTKLALRNIETAKILTTVYGPTGQTPDTPSQTNVPTVTPSQIPALYESIQDHYSITIPSRPQYCIQDFISPT